MNYEQKYKEALERAKNFKETCNSAGIISWCDYIFPELKESKDEKIRKQIISFLKEFECDHYRSLDFSSWIAWLERQTEQKPINTDFKAKDCYVSNVDGKIHIVGKFEPKFKVGDWIVEPREGEPDGLWHIDRIEDGYYWSDKCGCTIEYADKNFHLWTIEDAKDGDVLVASDDSVFIFARVDGYACIHHIALANDGALKINPRLVGVWESVKGVKPATKEQRDLLFQKMKEAGYELHT